MRKGRLCLLCTKALYGQTLALGNKDEALAPAPGLDDWFQPQLGAFMILQTL